LYGALAPEYGIKLPNVPYDTVDKNQQAYMEDIAEHILLRQLEERRNSLATGLANFTFDELIKRGRDRMNIKDAHNALLQRGSIQTPDGMKLTGTRLGFVKKKETRMGVTPLPEHTYKCLECGSTNYTEIIGLPKTIYSGHYEGARCLDCGHEGKHWIPSTMVSETQENKAHTSSIVDPISF
jgi:DNA-directed RNA polymerase subunit RPC12/RpoP